jgi:hypothetical protein
MTGQSAFSISDITDGYVFAGVAASFDYLQSPIASPSIASSPPADLFVVDVKVGK